MSNTALATTASRLSAAQNVDNYAEGVAVHVNGDWEKHYQITFVSANWVDSCGDTIALSSRLRIPLTNYNADVNVVVPIKPFVQELVGDAPTITKQPKAINIGTGETARFYVQATGAPPLYYQWFHNGNPIEGAISNQFTVTNAYLADAGLYIVEVSNDFGLVMSSEVRLIIVWQQKNWRESSFWDDVADFFDSYTPAGLFYDHTA